MASIMVYKSICVILDGNTLEAIRCTIKEIGWDFTRRPQIWNLDEVRHDLNADEAEGFGASVQPLKDDGIALRRHEAD